MTADGHTVSYNYDPAGRRASLSSGGDVLATYGYDVDDRLTAVTQGGATSTMSYDDDGRETDVTYPGGYTQHDAFDADGNLTLREVARDGTTLGGVAYAYDAVGRRVAAWRSLNMSRLPDALPAGTCDDDDRLTSRGGRTYTYDDDGNLRSDGERQFTWNARGQLSSATTAAGQTFQLGYDTLGRRTSSTGPGTNLAFGFDGWNELTRSTDGSTATSVNGLGLDELFQRGGTVQLTDADGTPVGTGAADGTFTPATPTDALGRPATSPSASQLGWKSGAQDAAGLVNFRHRYYDTTDGRFISQDPLGLAGGSTDLYAFAGGDPINGADPTGLSFRTKFWDTAVFAANAAVGAGNGASFGALSAISGVHACGIAGTIATWGGAAVLGTVTGGVVADGVPFRFLANQALGNAAGGTIGTTSSSLASGQTPSPGDVIFGTVLGSASTAFHAAGTARLPNAVFRAPTDWWVRGASTIDWFDTYRIGPAVPTASNGFDLGWSTIGPALTGSTRKC